MQNETRQCDTCGTDCSTITAAHGHVDRCNLCHAHEVARIIVHDLRGTHGYDYPDYLDYELTDSDCEYIRLEGLDTGDMELMCHIRDVIRETACGGDDQ